jgi:hypothetical protein
MFRRLRTRDRRRCSEVFPSTSISVRTLPRPRSRAASTCRQIHPLRRSSIDLFATSVVRLFVFNIVLRYTDIAHFGNSSTSVRHQHPFEGLHVNEGIRSRGPRIHEKRLRVESVVISVWRNCKSSGTSVIDGAVSLRVCLRLLS